MVLLVEKSAEEVKVGLKLVADSITPDSSESNEGLKNTI